jgi:hypothetical protein
MPTFTTFTSAELQGAGSLVSTKFSKFNANTPYVFHLPSNYSGSTYFVLETVRNENQIYDSSSLKPFSTPKSIIFPIYETVDMVKSDYIVGFVLNNGDNRFVLYPLSLALPGDKIYLRATGDIDLEIEQTTLASQVWNNTTENWDEYSSLWGI